MSVFDVWAAVVPYYASLASSSDLDYMPDTDTTASVDDWEVVEEATMSVDWTFGTCGAPVGCSCNVV